MKTETITASSAPSEKAANAFLAPCVLAALVWLATCLYMFMIVPMQLDLYENLAKPESMRAALPRALRAALWVHEQYGTGILAFLGLFGCGVAYVFRSTKVANFMILFGAVTLGILVWVVMSCLPH